MARLLISKSSYISKLLQKFGIGLSGLKFYYDFPFLSKSALDQDSIAATATPYS